MTQIEDMTFNHFIAWATGYIIVGLGEGRTIESSLWGIFSSFTTQWLPANGWERTDTKPKKKGREKK